MSKKLSNISFIISFSLYRLSTIRGNIFRHITYQNLLHNLVHNILVTKLYNSTTQRTNNISKFFC